jgi:hypothetical protein
MIEGGVGCSGILRGPGLKPQWGTQGGLLGLAWQQACLGVFWAA